MKLERYLRLLRIFSRPFGASQFNNDGRLSKWYAVTLLNFIVGTVGRLFYLRRVFRTIGKNYFTDRPFQLIMVLISMLISFGNDLAAVLFLRLPFTASNVARIELQTRREISYPCGFLLFDVGFIALFRFCHATVTCIQFYIKGILPPFDAFIVLISRYHPELTQYVALMYYCCILQLFGCVIRDEGNILGRLFSSYPLVFFLIQMFNLFKSCHNVKREIELLLEEMFLREMGRKGHSDKRLKTYFILKPKLDLSVGRFFEPSLYLFMQLMSSTVFFYLLMLQMNVLKSTFSSSV
ncbi:Hypothetical protein NTJ_02465 [Nesidiocoris tenuis]|uniref:Gustatory receptor n=1 Tax=Nesidiocoris tenuis TaxID=355587 RepID=A0ABN7AC89_9HEMI|nr:Hypothetical protein NTJ_02465 [Nesidiocoris tenuis]